MTEQAATVRVGVPKEGSSLDAIQRAAYRYLDRLTVDVTAEDSEFVCVLSWRSADDEHADELVRQFKAELLDQSLRERIRAETSAMRNLILAATFSRTALSGQELDADSSTS